MMQLSRFGVILTVLLGAAWSGGVRSASAATPGQGGGRLPGAPAKLSLLPAGLAQAVEQTLGPAAAAKPDSLAEQQELTAPDSAPNDYFGYSVALSNDGHTALIGTPGKNGYQGAAYVFTEQANTWTEQQELTAPDGAGNLFGYSVTLSNNGHTALIGAPSKNANRGAAYIFTENH